MATEIYSRLADAVAAGKRESAVIAAENACGTLSTLDIILSYFRYWNSDAS
ncbi:MAG: hypothetical protein LBU81_04795 [Methanosarcinales archaeon]|jgi:hypothetical protein|nr:hypothetical protein [Methanosarcinales archaeon]